MRRYLRLAAGFLLFCALPLQYARAEDLPLAPDFELQDLYQDIYTLSSYKDKKPVLLFFWTTWCPFCRKELSVLNSMYAGLVKDGLEILAIDVGELTDKVDQFVKNNPLAYKVLLDTDTSVATAYNIIGFPTYVLVDKQGYILFMDNYFPQDEYKTLISE